MTTTSLALTLSYDDRKMLESYRYAAKAAAIVATQHAEQAARSSEAYRTALRQLMVQGQYCRDDADSILAARRKAWLAAKAAALPAVAPETPEMELDRARVWLAQAEAAKAAHLVAKAAYQAAKAAKA